MKTIRLLFKFLILNSTLQICHAQAGTWTWMKGDSTPNSPGSYGVQGVPSATNEPRERYACASWTDTAGNFWVYSGTNAADDLWQFNPQTLQWTWMTGTTNTNATKVVTVAKGVYDPGNSPGQIGYGMFAWVTSDNHLWFYGGGYPVKADLWQYNPAINQWAWMGNFGATNYGTQGVGTATTMPGARYESNCAWTDNSGNLWLFGGAFSGFGTINDLWKYNISTGIWTWINGTGNASDTGSYGTIGVPSVNNYPAARGTNFFWKDSLDNFWVGGGAGGKISSTNPIMFQDIWKFNPQTLQWTWVKGVAGNDSIMIGVNCVADTLNKLGPRYENRADWKICDDLIITYSGFNDFNIAYGPNDMWAYKVSQNEWIKINEWDSVGRFGQQGVANAANYPTYRSGAVSFKDMYNNLWMFSGSAASGRGDRNDLWKYVLDNSCLGNLICSNSVQSALQDSTYSNAANCFGVCNGSGGVVASGGTAPYRYQWQPTGDTTAAISNLCAGTYYVTITDANNTTITDSITIFAPIQDTILISADTNAICFGDSIQLCPLAGFVSYQWNTGDTTPCVQAMQPGGYYVMVTDNNGCTATSDTFDVAVFPDPLDSIYSNRNIFCADDSTLVCAQASFFNYQWNVGGTGSCIYATQAGDYYVTITDANGCTDESNHISLSVYPAQSVSIVRNGDTLSSFGAVSYQWLLNNNPIDGATGPVFVAHQQGSYAVEVTDTNGCTTTSSPVLVTGINDLTENESVSLFPNPNSVGSWQLIVDNSLLGSNLEVYDDEGRLVFQSEIHDLKSEITVITLPNGVYFLRISNGKVSVVRKLVKI